MSPTSNSKLNIPAQIFHGAVFYICIVMGRSSLGIFPPFSFNFSWFNYSSSLWKFYGSVLAKWPKINKYVWSTG
jgi:hypothetical protein